MNGSNILNLQTGNIFQRTNRWIVSTLPIFYIFITLPSPWHLYPDGDLSLHLPVPKHTLQSSPLLNLPVPSQCLHFPVPLQFGHVSIIHPSFKNIVFHYTKI